MKVPGCVLLAGLPGAGKTVLAKELAQNNFHRLCPDDEMAARYGRRGIDFARSEYLARERQVLTDAAIELREVLTSGADVVLDHGLWTAQERAWWRGTVVEAGAVPVVVYLPAPHDVRWARVRDRNALPEDHSPAHFSEEDLLRYAARFEVPTEEEGAMVYDGRPESVMTAVLATRRDDPEAVRKAGRR